MLGPAKPRRLDQPIAVSLEALVPANHVSRHLEATLDLDFVRAWAKDCYAERGRPSIDPVVFFKRQLVMFFEGMRSERQLIATASRNLAHRWQLGYALDETLPDHSSLTRIRHRLGIAIFARCFERIVDLCQDAGLVWGRERSFDATKVAANADLDSLAPRFSDDAKMHLADLFADRAAMSDKPLAAPENILPPEVVLLPVARTVDASSATASPWRRLEERRLDPSRPAVGSYQRTTDFRVSTTDPDATPMRIGSGTRLGDHDHSGVDGGKARLMLAALVTPADVMENVPLRDLLWRVCFRRKLRPARVTGDTTSGTIANIVALAREPMRASGPRSAAGHRAGLFGDADVAFDPATDAYRCPAGQTLRFLAQREATHRRIDQARARRARSARSARNAQPRPEDGASAAVWTRPSWTGCEGITRPRPIRRPCASGRSGWSRGSPKPKPGTA